MIQYEKRPVIVNAVRWEGDNFDEIKELAGGNAELFTTTRNVGDWLVQSGGEYISAWTPEAFEKTFRPFRCAHVELIEELTIHLSSRRKAKSITARCRMCAEEVVVEKDKPTQEI